MMDQLGNSDPRVVQAASFALGKIGPAAKAAVPALTKLNQSDDELLRLISVWAVLKIGPRTDELVKSSMPILMTALKNSREFVRIEAAMTLGELGAAAGAALPRWNRRRATAARRCEAPATAAIKKIRG